MNFAITAASLSTQYLLVTLTGVLSFLLIKFLRKCIKIPGPWGVPVLGYYPFLRKDYFIHLHELAKTHGEVYVMNIAGQNYLHLNSIRATREAHVNQWQHFHARSNKYSICEIAFDQGLLTLNGDSWKTQRRFFLQAIRDVGIAPNKNELKFEVAEAVRQAVSICMKSTEKVINLTFIFCEVCTAPLLKLTFGDCVPPNEMKDFNDVYYEVLVDMSSSKMLLLGNLARYIVYPFSPGYSKTMANLEKIKKLIKLKIQQKKRNFDPEKHPTDFIDRFFKERLLLKEQGDSRYTCYTDDSLLGTVLQLYGDGALSTALFVASFLYDLSFYPEVQDKVYEEIIQVVGKNRFPGLEDRPQLPITSATVKELERTSSIFLIFQGFECTGNIVKVLGVEVPKGSVTLSNNWAINHDPNVFQNPHVFDPKRFLPESAKTEQPVNFGIGKRSCPAEGFVMAETFLFVAGFLQSFKLFPATTFEEFRLEKKHPSYNFQARIYSR